MTLAKQANTHNCCPECRSTNVKTTEVRGVRFTGRRNHSYLDPEITEMFRQQGIRATRRRKVCPDCGHRWTTYEFSGDGLKAISDYVFLNAHRRAA